MLKALHKTVIRTAQSTALIAALLTAPHAAAAEALARPFGAGEVLTYDVTIGALGRGGRGALRVDAAPKVRGEGVVQLRFDFQDRVGPFMVRHHSSSLLSTERFASLQYVVSEATPAGDIRKNVRIIPEEQRWEDGGAAGTVTAAEPLDELSFIYALRGMKLSPGESYELARHYDSKRGPAHVRVLRRATVKVPAGEFPTLVIELEVDDPVRFGGKGLLRLFLSDDARRLPVRIESKVPVAGQLTLQLRSVVLPAEPRVEVVP